MKPEFLKYINTTLLTVITAGVSIFGYQLQQLKEDNKTMATQQAVEISTIQAITSKINELDTRLTQIESGSHPSTKDRYTFEDSQRTIEYLKEWTKSNCDCK